MLNIIFQNAKKCEKFKKNQNGIKFKFTFKSGWKIVSLKQKTVKYF